MDTDDLVQETVIRAVKDEPSESRTCSLQAYLPGRRQRIRDEIRRAGRSPATKELMREPKGRRRVAAE
jgi:DNA-directed RNA polymerase specialized sigma24 family protein